MNSRDTTQRVKELERENEELRKKYEDVKKQYEELKKRLRAYENPHTPSSRRLFKNIVKTKKPGKRGAPKGHRGATHKKLSPDRIVELAPERCPCCGGRRIQISKTPHKKTVEDIQITKITTEYHYYDCQCETCRKKFTTSCAGLPKKGNFGPNISALWNMLHYEGAVPFERLARISKNCLGMSITPSGLHNAIYRTTGIFKSYFNRIRNRVAKSRYVRSDETVYPFNGKHWWLWNISTEKDSLVLLRNSRASKVLKEVFGEFLDGILNSDCFSAYQKFKAKEYQKCWPHALRSAKDLAEHNDEGAELYGMLSRMYAYIKKAKLKKREGTESVKQWVRRSKKKITAWLNDGRNIESKAVLNLVLRMEKYRDQWFTCLKYPFVEPTNNSSERDIRKMVIARKISGQHRSELGLRSREIMMSTILTLRRRKRNPFEFVLREIEKHNLRPTVS